jgi:trimeric autotransporter adhesin
VSNLRATLRTLILAAVAVCTLPLHAQSASEIDVPLRNWEVPFSQSASPSGRTRMQSNALPTDPSLFVAITPCRILDTRGSTGTYGGPAIPTGGTRTFDVNSGPCAGIPEGAAAYSLNITAVLPSGTGHVRVYPAGGSLPTVSTLNFVANETVANAAIVPAGTGGAISVYAGILTHVLVDINGYFLENAVAGNGSLDGANTWTGLNTFAGGLSMNNQRITNLGNPNGPGDAANKAYVDGNFVKFVPGAEQLSVGDANGTAPMINLRGGSTCCSGPGGHTPAWFKVFQNGSFVATGNLGIGISPMQGKGYRTSWDSYKGAFRSGYADNEWDDANVGFFSWAGGSNSTAIGLYALAFGDTNQAESTSSIVFGSGNQVKGAAGFSAGAGNRVCDTYGVALGNNAKSGGPLINGKCDPDTFNVRGLAAIAIGYNVTADQDHTTAMGKFASNNGFQGTFIWSDGSAQASADTFRNTANNEFAARATGGFRFRTNLGGTTGCNLPAGSGVFNCTSSRLTKENFAPVDGEAILATIRNLPITTWNYITEGKEARHIGPMAEDFASAFQLGTGNTSIGVQDLASVSLAAVQALEQRTAELQKKSEEVDTLRAQLAMLEERLAALERK